MESKKAEEWASLLQCWSLQLIICFAFKSEFLSVICKPEFLIKLPWMWSGLVNENSPAVYGYRLSSLVDSRSKYLPLKLKPGAANVLLDEDFEVVVGDFGLAKLVDVRKTNVTTQVRGTMGHIAPEYLSTGKSSERTDVFEEDVLLLDHVKKLEREKRLDAIVDRNLSRNYDSHEVEMMIQVALLCTQSSLEDRPTMSKVVRMLVGEGLAERGTYCHFYLGQCLVLSHPEDTAAVAPRSSAPTFQYDAAFDVVCARHCESSIDMADDSSGSVFLLYLLQEFFKKLDSRE
ncbi:hypothetical protein NE237_030910 [Protea cynaroides]|uniref:Protein kinase domain-containing protein n=1 Tax=Protea cynaroides TaxID=273540 RepID=A0A9Q0JXR2_9MAGN|nr:hypothetical protein NE237_030910 [Protea cynaroides]